MSPSLADAKLPELNQQAIEWLLRLRADDMSDQEMRAFADWLAQDYRHAEAFASAEDLFDDMVRAAVSDSAFSNAEANPAPQTVAPLPSLTPRRQKSARYRRWLPVAVAMAAVWLFAVILVMPENAHPLNNLFSDYHTETAEIRDIQLADGSRMLLNTNSAVSVHYANSIRQIVLHHGQARFSVAKDSQRPFEVLAGHLHARALGTVFEVYRPSEDKVSVTVQQHAVRVNIDDGHRPEHAAALQLQAGQRLQYRRDGTAPLVEAVDLDQATAWQQHRLMINDRPLGELLAELNRYRVGRIFVADSQLSNLRVTGVFALDNPDDIVHSVSEVLGLQETYLSNWWLLLHR